MARVGQSSLQKALETKTTRQSDTSSKGLFENCFARGLDLSEFAKNESSAPIESAAAQRLRQKQVERIEKEQNHREEERLGRSVADRVEYLKQEKTNQDAVAALLIQQPPSGASARKLPGALGSFLEIMHKTDKNEQRLVRGKKQRLRAGASSCKAKKKSSRSKHQH